MYEYRKTYEWGRGEACESECNSVHNFHVADDDDDDNNNINNNSFYYSELTEV